MAAAPSSSSGSASEVVAWVLRGLGVVLIVAGLVLLGIGITHFVSDVNSISSTSLDQTPTDHGPTPIIQIAGGGFGVVIGLSLLGSQRRRRRQDYSVPGARSALAAPSTGSTTPSERVCGCGAVADGAARSCLSCGRSFV